MLVEHAQVAIDLFVFHGPRHPAAVDELLVALAVVLRPDELLDDVLDLVLVRLERPVLEAHLVRLEAEYRVEDETGGKIVVVGQLLRRHARAGAGDLGQLVQLVAVACVLLLLLLRLVLLLLMLTHMVGILEVSKWKLEVRNCNPPLSVFFGTPTSDAPEEKKR
uniref:Uncharacterized protein n=1 Tax=Anopheles farauti TaxID=69004 RepID=A0A182QFR6_9DIPT